LKSPRTLFLLSKLGEHTEEVLGSLGYAADEIRALKANVI
jgi:crotonobetainyl-CoA:carnitine CoA-transferase CaiB-like acyl-CoA transferase